MPTSSPSSSRPAPSKSHESVAQAFLPARQRHEHQKQEFSPSTPSTAKYAKKKRTASVEAWCRGSSWFSWRSWRYLARNFFVSHGQECLAPRSSHRLKTFRESTDIYIASWGRGSGRPPSRKAESRR